MGKNADSFIDIDEVKRAFDTAISVVASQVGDEIQTAFDSAIVKFYSDYDPTSYDRTETMFQFSSGYRLGPKKPLFEKKGDMKYEAGIIVSPNNVSGNPYKKNHGIRVTPKFVFNVSYMKGIHGFNRNNVIYETNRRHGGIRRLIEPKWGVTDKKGRVLRKDNWKPGYNPLGGLKDRNSFFMDDYSIAENINAYNKTYNVRDHTPTNSIPPDVLMNRDYNSILKTIGAKMDKAFISALSR